MTARQRLLAAFLVLAAGFFWLLWGATETAFGGPPTCTPDRSACVSGTSCVGSDCVTAADPVIYAPSLVG